MKLKDNLRQKLKEHGITATSLSKKTKVPLQTLNNWLAGSKPRDLLQVKAVCDYFGLSFDELVFSQRHDDLNEGEMMSVGNFDVFLKKPSKDKRT